MATKKQSAARAKFTKAARAKNKNTKWAAPLPSAARRREAGRPALTEHATVSASTGVGQPQPRLGCPR